MKYFRKKLVSLNHKKGERSVKRIKKKKKEKTHYKERTTRSSSLDDNRRGVCHATGALRWSKLPPHVGLYLDHFLHSLLRTLSLSLSLSFFLFLPLFLHLPSYFSILSLFALFNVISISGQLEEERLVTDGRLLLLKGFPGRICSFFFHCSL